MKITVLAENTAKNSKLEYEHGLSLYIESNGKKILFDMGQSDLFARNAQKLNIDLSQVYFAIISHGHYDHGGGLAKFLEINDHAPIYINENAFEPYYNGTEKYIGLDTALCSNERIVKTPDEYKIADGFELHTCNNKQKTYNMGSFGLKKLKNSLFSDDDFLHEHYLLARENGRRILISGCSHKGILNISEWFDADTIVGGFHFSKLALDDELKHYAEILDSCPEVFYTCHCTGENQFEYMKKFMSKLNYISTGDVIEL